MGMSLDLKTRNLTPEEYKGLLSKEIYLSRWDLSLKTREELENNYKTLFFDIINHMTVKDSCGKLSLVISDIKANEDLFDFFMRTWQTIVEDLDYAVDMDDNDLYEYITFDEWKENVYDEDYYIEREVTEMRDGSCVLSQARFW